MLYCLLIPFLGTIFGSLLIFLIKGELNKKLEVVILGLTGGIMLAASIWSLIIPSIDIGNVYKTSLGLLIGIVIFIILDDYVINKDIYIGDKVMFAISIHNIPEGAAVGVLVSSYLNGNILLSSCLALSIGIALQNIPEGLIVSLSKVKTSNKINSFIYGVISALFELLGCIIALLFTNFIDILLPYMLAIAGGAMIYVIVLELVPGDNKYSKFNILSFIIGFIIMMILDVLL